MKILRRTKGIDLKSKSSVLNYDAVQDGSTALSGLITIRYTKRTENRKEKLHNEVNYG